MEYQKTINLLEYTPNQPTKFSTKNQVEINDDARGTYNTNSQIKFTISLPRSSLFDYSDAYILVGGNITVAPLAAGRRNNKNNNIQAVFTSCALFTNCISEINNTQIDGAKETDVIMPMYSLTKYGNNYSKTSGRLWQYHRDEPALTNADIIDNFPGNSTSYKFKQKITGSTGDDGTKAVQIMLPLKYLSNFWRTLEKPLINCEVILIMAWSMNCVISNAIANQETAFLISDTKPYVPVVTLSTQDNAKVFQQSKSRFKCTIDWNNIK